MLNVHISFESKIIFMQGDPALRSTASFSKWTKGVKDFGDKLFLWQFYTFVRYFFGCVHYPSLSCRADTSWFIFYLLWIKISCGSNFSKRCFKKFCLEDVRSRRGKEGIVELSRFVSLTISFFFLSPFVLFQHEYFLLSLVHSFGRCAHVR